ncbi:MAG: chitobiase/beta-hexosaminidase C-terminal domain-containing protein [Myxococcales bacterium]|nr:chitobiase/beta-hexosaminidase C-terminal domain-containing protein [Myxococcales bacterium]MDH3484371.1 chitobiase/beta-hexosaminidase C-terminal domain-containing protein [Myxococcales bacterium]
MKTDMPQVVRLGLAAILALGVGVTGCGDGDGGTGGTGGGGTGGGGTGGMGGGGMGGEGGSGGVVGAVTATPPGTTFNPTIEVTLSTMSGQPIYYTTDLSPVLDGDGNVQGTEYTGPITIDGQTTVLKFLTGTEGDYSAEQSEGYVFTETPIRTEWAKSGHGDITAEPWRRFDDGGAVSNRCAKCHGPQGNDDPPPDVGLLEYLATGENTLSAPLPLGIDCVNCHQTFPTIYSNLAKFGLPNGELEPVVFPSTEQVSLYGPSNICMTCHQGRESGKSVQDEIDADDGVGPYEFTNIHYYAAAASFFGSETDGGFEYAGQWYRPRNTFPSHPDTFSTCVGCHMTNAEGGEMHTWIPAVDSCISCHGGTSFETLGGTPGQSYTNIQALLPELYSEIQDYAATVIGVPIVYDGRFCNDNGEPCGRSNSYEDFDAKLLPAAYNYQVALKDPNGFIHNGTYIQQLLHDSIVDLGGTPSVAVIGRGELTIEGTDIGMVSKTQQWQLSAHAAADTPPFREWDNTYLPDGYTPRGIQSPSGEPVPGVSSCTRCHSTPGFEEYAMSNPTTVHFPTTTVDCWSCHNNNDLFANSETRYDVLGTNTALASIVFPSGDEASFGNASNICMGCHQGQNSTVQVDAATPNTVMQAPTDYDSYDFINIHYYAAAATLFGTDVRGGYEYGGNVYRGQNMFVGLHNPTPDGQTLVDCIGCHLNGAVDPADRQRHTFLPQVQDCNQCHSGQAFQDLSGSPGDNFREIDILKEDLLAAIQAYATTGNPLTGLPQDSPVFYNGDTYPYWFNGIEGMDPASYPNRYRDFDFDMLTAAYNFVTADKDPAGYIHNGGYIQQLLFDSICLMGGTPRVVTVPSRPTSCP